MDDAQIQLANEEMIQLTAEINRETDRAAVILAGAYLDVLLKDLIKSIMVGEPEVIEELVGRVDAPLGTFSSRIKASYCLNLITTEERANLEWIRKIRNGFAHRLVGVSLDVSPMREWVGLLTVSDPNIEPTSRREKFTVVAVRLMMEITLRIRRKNAEKTMNAA